jgi:hypothetical protein
VSLKATVTTTAQFNSKNPTIHLRTAPLNAGKNKYRFSAAKIGI